MLPDSGSPLGKPLIVEVFTMSNTTPTTTTWTAPKLKRIAANLAEGNGSLTGDGPNNGKS